MRPIFASLLMAALWSSAGVCWAQKAQPLDTLERVKAKALASNPDVPVAEAKVRVAEALLQVAIAELRQTRHRLGDKAKDHPDVGVAEAKVVVAEAQVQLMKAEASRSHQRLTDQIAVTYHEAAAAIHAEEEAFRRYARAIELSQRKAISAEESGGAELLYHKLKSERVAAQSRLQALVGGPVIVDATPKK